MILLKASLVILIYFFAFLFVFSQVFPFSPDLRSFEKTFVGFLDKSTFIADKIDFLVPDYLLDTYSFEWNGIVSSSIYFYDPPLGNGYLCIDIDLYFNDTREGVRLAWNWENVAGDPRFIHAGTIGYVLGVIPMGEDITYLVTEPEIVFDNYLDEIRVSFFYDNVFIYASCPYEKMLDRGLELVPGVDYAS